MHHPHLNQSQLNNNHVSFCIGQILPVWLLNIQWEHREAYADE